MIDLLQTLFAGNRTSKTDWLANVTSNYTYDAVYELTQVTQGNNTTESYSYDPVGNRLSSLAVAAYSYNNSNELISTSNASYTYDNNGNTLTKADSTGTTTYAWDYENRLTSVTLPGSGGTVSFKYDPFGRRVYKSSPSSTSIFVYDEDNLVEEANTSGAAVARYSQGQNIDDPLAMLRSGVTSYYDQDGLGSITSLTNSSAAAAETYTFDSFGKLKNSAGSLTNAFQYAGREFDAETGLYYNRARYYDPATARFLSEDPIGFLGSKNFYKYVANNPLNATDPSGLTTTVIIVYDPGPFGVGSYGSHSAVYIDNGGDPILYDPAGSYSADHQCGSGQTCSGTDADSKKFRNYHEKNGSTVKMFMFDTTPEEEKQIAKNIDIHGGANPFYCTISVVDVLKGVGPFKDLKPTYFPGSLANQLQQLQQGTSKK